MEGTAWRSIIGMEGNDMHKSQQQQQSHHSFVMGNGSGASGDSRVGVAPMVMAPVAPMLKSPLTPPLPVKIEEL
jgi:hypothetical protein